jgi:hypothetical protein
LKEGRNGRKEREEVTQEGMKAGKEVGRKVGR